MHTDNTEDNSYSGKMLFTPACTLQIASFILDTFDHLLIQWLGVLGVINSFVLTPKLLMKKLKTKQRKLQGLNTSLLKKFFKYTSL